MFIEVLVVGIGTLSAGTLLLIALIGPATTAKLAPATDSTLVAGAALAAAYALGVLTDRVADTTFMPIDRRLRTASFPTEASYARARLRLAEIPSLSAQADYARSRTRICRGWAFNTAALILTSDLALLRYSFDRRPLVMGAITVLGLLIAFGFYRSWHMLTAISYSKLAEQTALLGPSPALPNQGPVQPQPGAGTSGTPN
ncbi:hypothetical protein GTY82_06940 [Streptomyces sp. SID5476]|uniref:Uncharacterized protein n=2 Tax=Streptomyces TaxID=1883 RepID=M3DIB3_9ACTN|nr:hypothetical protein SBD_2088 [Streptomyces bottropensis ATCC 25435]MZD16971.1 hypothetical protein [Streptomyces sp. SID5476]